MEKVHNRRIRQAAVAGAFYPDDVNALKSQIDFFLSNLEDRPVKGNIYGLICPHAGYVYSGQVAAAGYKQLLGRDYSVVVVISPSHREYFDGISIYNGDGYETPFGVVEIDEVLATQLAEQGEPFLRSESGHREEHALEVQLPFLQRVLGDFRLIPIVMGDQNYDYSLALGEALAKVLRHQQALIVASSDLSHYYPYEEAKRMDQRVVDRVEAFDYEGLWNDIESRKSEACGYGPMVAAMVAAKKMGANRSAILMYRNSGDVTGDRSAVVGYLSAALYKG